MKTNRANLEKAVTSKEYKIINNFDDPWSECCCPCRVRRNGSKYRPGHTKTGKCRHGNGHKSWKNYRMTQYREK